MKAWTYFIHSGQTSARGKCSLCTFNKSSWHWWPSNSSCLIIFIFFLAHLPCGLLHTCVRLTTFQARTPACTSHMRTYTPARHTRTLRSPLHARSTALHRSQSIHTGAVFPVTQWGLGTRWGCSMWQTRWWAATEYITKKNYGIYTRSNHSLYLPADLTTGFVASVN